MKKNGSHLFFVYICLGIVVGALLGGFSPKLGKMVYFLGELFLRTLLMLVMPLIICSIIVGVSKLGDIRKLGGLGGKTVLFYLTTTALSVLVGLVLVNIIAPGHAKTQQERIQLRGGVFLPQELYQIQKEQIWIALPKKHRKYENRYMVWLEDQEVYGVITQHIDSKGLVVQQWLDKEGKKIIPKNSGKGIRIDLVAVEKVKQKKSSILGVLKKVIMGFIPQNIFAAMANNDVLPIIIISLIFGAIFTTMGERGQLILEICNTINDAVMKFIQGLMKCTPIGVGALIAGRLGEAGGFSGFVPELLRLGQYSLTVILGLFIHAAIILPCILYIFTKRSPWRYFLNVLDAIITSFSTASSSATLPITMKNCIKNNQISERTASFVLPLGATVNMDGTALYESVAAVFIAQLYGYTLGIPEMAVIFFTATLAAIGAAGIPEAGLVTMVIVLRAVNLPIEGISLLLIIDWFLDRCRTAVNVWGDSIGAGVIDNLDI